MKYKISKEKPIVGIWGIQDGSGFPDSHWSEYYPTHDHSFCIISNRKVENYLELERITRVKHDNHLSDYIEDFNPYFPDDFIAVSVNQYIGNSFISKNGMWRIEGDRFDVSELIKPAHAYINRAERESYVCSHELAHIGSILPFVGKFEENSLLVHIDGLASDSCFSVFHYINGEIKYIYHGWEPLEVAQIFGFNDMTCSMLGLNENHRLAVPGRLMGYSSYGIDYKNVREWLKEKKWYRNLWSEQNNFFEDASIVFNKDISAFNLREQCFMDVAASCQSELEEVLFELLAKYKDMTKADHLYYSGGVALNIDFNTKLHNSKLFDNIYVPPCCSDAGLALGAAAIISLLRGEEMILHSPFINSVGVNGKIVKEINNDLLDEIVKRLANGQIMGTCIGLAECGPRALGHRSIMGTPTSQEMFNRVNHDIKKREWYRPLAPIVIDKLANDIFNYSSSDNVLAKYMLANFVVNESWREKLPAITHINNTARVQVIDRNDKELTPIYQILEKLWLDTGIPCLINTSFNGQGEPIIHTDEDAIRSGKNLGIDFILFDDRIVNL